MIRSIKGFARQNTRDLAGFALFLELDSGVFLRVLERSELRTITEVRLVKDDGENEIVPVMEAWRQAEIAQLNLVLVSSEEAIPPVVRIQDYNKLMFEKKKARNTASKTKKRKQELKEIQLKANISDHDLQTKVNNINKFLTRGDKVKVIVRLKGRERENPKRAHDLIDKVMDTVETTCKMKKLAGPVATAILEPA